MDSDTQAPICQVKQLDTREKVQAYYFFCILTLVQESP